MKATVSLSFLFLLPLLGGRPAAQAVERPERLAPDPSELPAPLHCPVDGQRVKDRRYGAIWQGKRYFMESEECLRMFMEEPDRFARAVEPRAALFSAPHADRPAYGPLWLALALYVVAGLVFGGLTSFLAIQKGLSGRRWFAAGFFLSLIGFGLVLYCRGRPMPFQKKGICKTPQTHDPVACLHCGKPNHPAARRCSRCGGELRPRVEGDVSRLHA